MAVELVRVPELLAGVPYSYAARAAGPDLVFTAGACPLDQEGRVVAPGDVSAQARLCPENLRAALREAGAVIGDVVKTTVFVAGADRADLVAAWGEVAAFFGGHDAPSTLLGVTVLGYPGQPVEIEAIAATSAG